MVDTTGSTPSQLAAQKGHMMCADWLAHERAKVERKAAAKGLFRGGAPRGLKHLAPVLWCIILGAPSPTSASPVARRPSPVDERYRIQPTPRAQGAGPPPVSRSRKRR